MDFRFLHTADWQLGKRFGQFPDGLSARLQAQRVEVVARLRDLAEQRSIRHILVAGDVWDMEQPSQAAILQPLEEMGRNPDIHWHLIPGNHDPARPRGLWARVETAAPANVHLYLSPAPREIDPGVFLLPAPWTSKRPGRDLTEDFDRMETPDGALRIGLAHGPVAEFVSDAPQSAAIAPDRAERARLDYLALGDWHGKLSINTRTHYSGTPEPDRFPRNEPGYALDVTLTPGAEPKITPHATAHFDWRRVALSAQSGTDISRQIEETLSGAELRRTLLRLELSGALPQTEHAQLMHYLDALSGRTAHLRRRGDLRAQRIIDDLDALDLGGSVRSVAEDLLAQSTASDDDGAKDARRALDLLFELAAADSEDGPTETGAEAS